jgi:hypothetical protein
MKSRLHLCFIRARPIFYFTKPNPDKRGLNIQSFELPLFETQFRKPQPDKTLHLLPSPSNSSARPPKSSNPIFLQLFIDTLKDLTIGQIFPILFI